MDEPPSGEQKNGLGGEYGPFLTLGLQLAIAVVVFFFVGYWLDQKFETSPWCTIAGAVFGSLGGMVKLVRDAQKLNKLAEKGWKEVESHKRED